MSRPTPSSESASNRRRLGVCSRTRRRGACAQPWYDGRSTAGRSRKRKYPRTSEFEQCDRRSEHGERRARPENEHPLDEIGAEGVQPCVEPTNFLSYVGLYLRDALLQFRIEPGEVDLVQLPQLEPVRGVHLVEPVDELVRDLVSKGIVEPARQPRRDRQSTLLCVAGTV